MGISGEILALLGSLASIIALLLFLLLERQRLVALVKAAAFRNSEKLEGILGFGGCLLFISCFLGVFLLVAELVDQEWGFDRGNGMLAWALAWLILFAFAFAIGRLLTLGAALFRSSAARDGLILLVFGVGFFGFFYLAVLTGEIVYRALKALF